MRKGSQSMLTTRLAIISGVEKGVESHTAKKRVKTIIDSQLISQLNQSHIKCT